MIEVEANDPRVTELDRQITQWHRPASLNAWNQELAVLGQVPGNVEEQAGWVMLCAGATAAWILFTIMAWASCPWGVGLTMTIMTGWATWKVWRAYAAAQAWKRDPRQVRLSLLQEYPTDSLAFRWESQDHPDLQVAYRKIRQAKVPILRGDVEHLRRIHGVKDTGDSAMIVLFFGGCMVMTAILALVMLPLAPVLKGSP